jgi:hypothetical protein
MNKLRIDSGSEDLTFLEGLQAHRLSAAAGLRASAEGGIEPPYDHQIQRVYLTPR